MKKLIAVILLVCMIVSWALAEGPEIMFYSVFGLTEGATNEEISKAIQNTFSVKPSSINENNFYPDEKFFYNFPISWIIMTNDRLGKYRGFEIELKEECLSAENLYLFYQKFCDEFGDPVVCELEHEIITINGKEKAPLTIDDMDAIQNAIDQSSFSGLICWNNISINARSYIYDLTSKPKKTKVFTFYFAFTKDSLKRQVRMYYSTSND